MLIDFLILWEDDFDFASFLCFYSLGQRNQSSLFDYLYVGVKFGHVFIIANSDDKGEFACCNVYYVAGSLGSEHSNVK